MKLLFKTILFVFLLNSIASAAVSTYGANIFRRGNYDEPETLDPQKALAISDINILLDLYEGLMTYNNKGQLILGQAQSYHVSSDRKVYTFKLKKDLKWSNGESLTAADFVAGFNRIKDPKVESTNSFLLENIKSFKAIDGLTLEIILDKPIPYLLDLLTHPTFSPVFKPNDNKYNIYITNGPFKLDKWVVNSRIVLVKNKFYDSADQVKLDKVIFYPINQQSIELKRYRAGDLDYTNKVPSIELDWVKKNLKSELYSKPVLASFYYTFNVTKPPFENNKNLRKALALAIDKKIIAEKILGGNRMATDRFVPNGISNYINTGNIESLNQSQLAKKYYNLAGYNINKPFNIKLLFHTNEANKTIAAAVASMWKKNLGINTELINQEWKVYLKAKLDKSQTEIIREGWIAPFDDPIGFLGIFVSDNPQNASGFNNAAYDNLIYKAEKESDISVRAKLLKQAEDILLEEAPIVPIYTPEAYHLVKPYIGGFNVDNRDRTYDKYIYIIPTQ